MVRLRRGSVPGESGRDFPGGGSAGIAARLLGLDCDGSAGDVVGAQRGAPVRAGAGRGAVRGIRPRAAADQQSAGAAVGAARGRADVGDGRGTGDPRGRRGEAVGGGELEARAAGGHGGRDVAGPRGLLMGGAARGRPGALAGVWRVGNLDAGRRVIEQRSVEHPPERAGGPVGGVQPGDQHQAGGGRRVAHDHGGGRPGGRKSAGTRDGRKRRNVGRVGAGAGVAI